MTVNLNKLVLVMQQPQDGVFNADGMPLTDAGAPLYVGYSETKPTGDDSFTATITSIVPLSSGLLVDYDVVMTYGFGLRMEGSATDTYALLSNGDIRYSGSFSVGSVGAEDRASYVMETSGVLSKDGAAGDTDCPLIFDATQEDLVR